MDSEVVYMKKILVFVFALATIFGITKEDIAEVWRSSQYVAYRFFVEESDFPKIRYEKVYKNGDDKLVFVLNPKSLVWVRMNEDCWMGDKVLYKVPSGIKDLEDVALEALEESTDATIVEGDGWYMLEYETRKGYFKVDIDESGIPMDIYRKIDGIVMKMDIHPVLEDLKDFKALLDGRKLSEELAFPKELGDIFKIFDWFSMKEENERIVIKGIINKKWHKIEVAFRRFKGCVKYGGLCVKSDPEVLKLLEGGSD